MRRSSLLSAFTVVLVARALAAQQTPPTTNLPLSEGPYKVVKIAKVGNEGGTDYIFADVVGRRLYIPRGAVRADTVRNTPAIAPRITVFDLETLAPLGEVNAAPNSQGNGAVVDPKTGHGFASSRPAITMFDAKTGRLFLMSVEREPAQPPAPGARPQRPRAIPGSFTIVVIGKP